MRFKSYSKITWTFSVLGQFPKNHINYGYTNIEIASFLINLYDEIEIKISKSSKTKTIINCDNSHIPQTNNGMAEKNICFRAVEELKKEIPNFPAKKIEINIQKNIPIGGGLGGSSTNGVAVINGLNKLLKLNLSRGQIMNMALRLGSDTMFFASNYKKAIMRGRGEILEKLPALKRKIWLVLATTGIEILSKNGYGGLKKINYKNCNQKIKRLSYSTHLKKLLEKNADNQELTACLYNDMEKSPSTFKKHPILLDIKKSLVKSGCLNAVMSGSGSTVFGVCKSKSEAKKIVGKIKNEYPQFEFSVCST